MASQDLQVPAIQIKKLSKTFDCCKALDDINLQVNKGEMVALIGPSGSGKSTLLRHISGLVPGDRINESGIHIYGRPIQEKGSVSRDVRRIRSEVGFVFQQFNLVGRLSLLTNILTGSLSRIPTWRSLLGLFKKEEKIAAMEALHRVGMSAYAGQRASTLSGGQQQRGAIARALLQQASIILADEPIASLDPQSASLVMGSLQKLNQEDGRTVVVSLHQIDYAFRYCPRSVALKDGQIVYDGPTREVTIELLRSVYGEDLPEMESLMDRESAPTPWEPAQQEDAQEDYTPEVGIAEPAYST